MKEVKEILEGIPKVKVWGESLGERGNVNSYKGKFVMTGDGKFLAKLFPEDQWDSSSFFHNMIIEELGIEDGESPEVKALIFGGGKIEVELMEDYAECRLHGKSTVYGNYNKEDIDMTELAEAIQEAFSLEIPIQVIPEYEE